MDDIVIRLRKCWCSDAHRSRQLVDPECDHDGLRSEAADEIERLRQMVDTFHKLAKHFYEQVVRSE